MQFSLGRSRFYLAFLLLELLLEVLKEVGVEVLTTAES
jgi:hypothetical protein